MQGFVELLTLADSRFPTGGYAHSWGLEWAIQQGLVASGHDLESWLDSTFRGSFLTLDARAGALAWCEADGWNAQRAEALNAELAAFRPGAAQRKAQAQSGRSFWRSVSLCFPGSIPETPLEWLATTEEEDAVQFALAWGWVGGWLALELGPWIDALGFGYLRQAIQVGIRLIPLGQDEAFAILGRLVRSLLSNGDWLTEAGRPWKSFTPVADAAGLGHAELERKYFRS